MLFSWTFPKDDLDSLFLQVAPKPAFCVKTKNKEGVKVFLNICTCSDIPEPRYLLNACIVLAEMFGC